MPSTGYNIAPSLFPPAVADLRKTHDVHNIEWNHGEKVWKDLYKFYRVTKYQYVLTLNFSKKAVCSVTLSVRLFSDSLPQ